MMGERRDFKFGVLVDHSMSLYKPSMKGAWSHHVTHFKILALPVLAITFLAYG